MGCDIHAYVEVNNNGTWELDKEIFDVRHYGLFGWLANVRNYSGIKPLSEPRGIPEDISDAVKRQLECWAMDAHSCSYLTGEDLLNVNYDQIVWDRRVMRGNDGGCTTDNPSEGRRLTLRQFLNGEVMRDILSLNKYPDRSKVRVVFWFDN
jgi:hypothetical protein